MFPHPDTPPSTPSPTTQVKENSDPSIESQIEDLKRQSSEALSEKVVDTMKSITNMLTELEGQEGFEMKEDGYHIDMEDLVGTPVSLQSSIILECESLSDISRDLDRMSVCSMPEVEDEVFTLISVEPPSDSDSEPQAEAQLTTSGAEIPEKKEPTKNDITEQKETTEDEITEQKETTEDEITEETTETMSHEITGCETCEELSAESLVSDPEPSIFITPQIMIAVHSAPATDDDIIRDAVGTVKVSETGNVLPVESDHKPTATSLGETEIPKAELVDNTKLEDQTPPESNIPDILENDDKLGTIEITVDADQIIAVQGIDTSNDSLDLSDGKILDLDKSNECIQPQKTEELKIIEEVEEHPQKDESLSDDDPKQREEILAELGQVFVRDESLHTSPQELQLDNFNVAAEENLGTILEDEEVPASITVSMMPYKEEDNVKPGIEEDLSTKIASKLADSSVDSLLTSDELESNPEVVQKERAPEVEVDLSLINFLKPVVSNSDLSPSIDAEFDQNKGTDPVVALETEKEVEKSLALDILSPPTVSEQLESVDKDTNELASSSTDSILTPDEVDSNSEVVESSIKALDIDIDFSLPKSEKSDLAMESTVENPVEEEFEKAPVVETTPAESNSEAEQILRSSSTSSSNSSYSSFEGADGQRIKIKRRRTSNYVDSAKSKEPIVHLELQLEQEQEVTEIEDETDQINLRNDLKRLLSEEETTVRLEVDKVVDKHELNMVVEPSDEQDPEPEIERKVAEINIDLSEDVNTDNLLGEMDDVEPKTDNDFRSNSVELSLQEIKKISVSSSSSSSSSSESKSEHGEIITETLVVVDLSPETEKEKELETEKSLSADASIALEADLVTPLPDQSIEKSELVSELALEYQDSAVVEVPPEESFEHVEIANEEINVEPEPQTIPLISLNDGLNLDENPVVEVALNAPQNLYQAESEEIEKEAIAIVQEFDTNEKAPSSLVTDSSIVLESKSDEDPVPISYHDLSHISPDVADNLEEPITPPQAVLRRNSGVSISSSSSDSGSETHEGVVEQHFATIEEVESDDSSICSASDLRESMQRFHMMKRSLSVDDCIDDSAEVGETDLEVVTPDLNLTLENQATLDTTEIDLEHPHEDSSPAPGDIHIPLSVILSSNSSRKSSSSSSDSGSEKLSPTPFTEPKFDGTVEISVEKSCDEKVDIIPDNEMNDIDVRDFVNSQIQIALEKTLELEENPKITSEMEPRNQISVTNTTFSLISDVPDVQIKHLGSETKIASRKSSSSSSSESESEIPDINLEEVTKTVKVFSRKSSSSSSEKEVECPEIDLVETKTASRKSSSSSPEGEEEVVMQPEINPGDGIELNVSRKSSLSSVKEAEPLEIEIPSKPEGLEPLEDGSVSLTVHDQSTLSTDEEPLKVESISAIEVETTVHESLSKSNSSSNSLKSGSESSLSSKSSCSSASKNVVEIDEKEKVVVMEDTVPECENVPPMPNEEAVSVDEIDKESPYGTLAIAIETNMEESTPPENPTLSKDLSLDISQSSIASSSSSDKDSGSDGDGKTDLTEVTEIVEAEKLVLAYEENPDIDAPQAVTMSKESPTIDKIKLVNTPEESPTTDKLLLTEPEKNNPDVDYVEPEESHTVDKTNLPEEGYLVIDKIEPEDVPEQTPIVETSAVEITPEDSPAIENITVINTPDLIEADSDSDSLSEEEGFCESDAMQSILDMMTGSTVSMTGEEIEDELRSLSSSSSRSTVARNEEESADAETPEPPTADSRTPSPEVTEDFSTRSSVEPSEDMRTPSIEPAEVDEESTPEPPTVSPEPPAESPTELPSYSVVSEDVDVKELERKVESQPETVRQESINALTILSQDSSDDITEDRTTSSKEQSEEAPQSQTLNSSSLGTYDLSTTMNTDPNLTMDSKEKLFLKTKWPKYDPVLGKSFALACKVRLRGFELRDQDIKNNASIRLYKDEDLLSVQPKFINGYFVFKIKSPTLADSGWYNFTVNMLDYEASEGQDINIALKGSKNKRTKSMNSIGSLGSLGSLFSVNNKTQNRR